MLRPELYRIATYATHRLLVCLHARTRNCWRKVPPRATAMGRTIVELYVFVMSYYVCDCCGVCREFAYEHVCPQGAISRIQDAARAYVYVYLIV